jgi:protein SCO1/2
MRAVTSLIVLIGLGGTLSSVPARAGGVQAVTAVERSPVTAAAMVEPIDIRDSRRIVSTWGISVESLRLTASGFMLDFRYRVLDAGKAKPLFLRKTKPVLKDELSGTVMTVPVPPKTGALRNSNDPKAGKSYFMFFSNPARFIKPGSLVTITIGEFSISGVRVTSDEEELALTEQATQTASGHEKHAAEQATPAASGHEGHAAEQATPAASGHEGHTVTMAAAPAARVLMPQPTLADVALVDHRGDETSLRNVLDTDKPVLLNFIFTSCTTICPVMTTGFAQLQDRLGADRADVRLVSISIDPEIDTVETLRSYAERYGAGDSWRFLTGTPASVEAAQRAFGAYRGGKNNHAPVTFFRRSQGSPWQAVDGLSSAEALLRAYRGEPPASGL